MLNIHWTEVIVILGAVQGLFLTVSIRKVAKRNKEATKILAWLLFATSFMLVGRLAYMRYDPTWPFQWTLVPDVVIFLFGPLIYFFIRRLLYDESLSRRSILLHYIPAVLHMGAFFYSLRYSAETYRSMAYGGELFYYFNITEGTAILLNIGYLGLAIKLMYEYGLALKEKMQRRLKYLALILFSILITVGVWAFGFIASVFFDNPSYYEVIWSVIPCVTFLVAYGVISDPEILRIIVQKKESTQKVKEQDIAEIKLKLENMMVREKLYEEPKLRMNELAIKLGISPNQMSWLLNDIYQMTFYDFLNEYRINAFIEKLNRNEHDGKTLLALAYEVGFNSKTTFNKSFKKVTSYTPRDYLNKQLQVA